MLHLWNVMSLIFKIFCFFFFFVRLKLLSLTLFEIFKCGSVRPKCFIIFAIGVDELSVRYTEQIKKQFCDCSYWGLPCESAIIGFLGHFFRFSKTSSGFLFRGFNSFLPDITITISADAIAIRINEHKFSPSRAQSTRTWIALKFQMLCMRWYFVTYTHMCVCVRESSMNYYANWIWNITGLNNTPPALALINQFNWTVFATTKSPSKFELPVNGVYIMIIPYSDRLITQKVIEITRITIIWDCKINSWGRRVRTHEFDVKKPIILWNECRCSFLSCLFAIENVDAYSTFVCFVLFFQANAIVKLFGGRSKELIFIIRKLLIN